MTELLIVGGLTVDRFSDGRSAPGGSVLHAGLAAVEEGVRPTILTVAGAEPEARAGLARLGELGHVVHQPAPTTVTYRHDESGPRRVLVFDAGTTPIDPDLELPIERPTVALLAPIADELSPAAVDALRARLQPRWTVMLIQGWLRRLAIGQPIHPLPLDAVGAEAWAAFGAADAIVVSTEDLAEAPEDPFTQAAELRHRLGRRPLLVLTLGPQGYLLDDPNADRLIASVPRRVVEGVPMVGAGDTFGAALALHLARGHGPQAAAEAATERVIEVLESRRS